MMTKFLYVGRLEKVKGIDILIEAFAKLDKKYLGNWTLNILGNGKSVKKIWSNDFIKFHGWADKEKVSQFMKESDCLIIPSRSESLPLVFLEAARFKLPVIVSNVGDCPHLVKKYRIGLVFEKGSADSLVGKLKTFLESGGRVVGGARFSDLNRSFSLEASVRKFIREII